MIAKQTTNQTKEKNMKNKWTIGGVIIAMAITATVQATPINGNITLGGNETLNGTSVNNSTTVTGWSAVTTGGAASGSFSGILAGTAVTMGSPWIFSPSTPTAALWSVGGFTFNLGTSTIITDSAGFLTIIGNGTITSTTAGLDPTAFAWRFGTQDPSSQLGNGAPVFTFSGATGSAVPDGGTTAMLLGIALSGVALLKKKLTA